MTQISNGDRQTDRQTPGNKHTGAQTDRQTWIYKHERVIEAKRYRQM